MRSSVEAFNEEMETDSERLTNWLTHYDLPQYPVHVSGHVMPLQLTSALKEVRAHKIIPTHTENARVLMEFMRDLPGKIAPPEKQKEYLV